MEEALDLSFDRLLMMMMIFDNAEMKLILTFSAALVTRTTFLKFPLSDFYTYRTCVDTWALQVTMMTFK